MLTTSNTLLPTATLPSGNSTATGNKNRVDDFASQLAEAIVEQAKNSAAEAGEHNNTPVTTAKEAVQDAREELMKILEMTPAERIRYTTLQDMGLTEEALAALPPDERMRIEEMIEEEIERQLAGRRGNDPYDMGIAALSTLQS